jgi:hypothetical protein
VVRIAALLVLLTSCDVAFRLDRSNVSEGTDARSDGPSTDDCPNAAGHDEDKDGVDDVCDNCPSISNADQLDSLEVAQGLAADGVGDACDPAPTEPGDQILLFQSLQSIVGFRTAGSVNFSSDSVQVGGDFAFLASNANFVPTRVEAAISFLNPTVGGQAVQLSADSGGFRCVIETSPCPATASVGCLTASAPVAGTTAFPDAGTFTRVTMSVSGSDLVCDAGVVAMAPGAFTMGQVAIYTQSATTLVDVQDIVVYGR